MTDKKPNIKTFPSSADASEYGFLAGSLFSLLLYLSALLLSGCAGGAMAPVVNKDSRTKSSPSVTSSNRQPAKQSTNKGYHIVGRGDTLYSIAWRYSFDYRLVAQWNDIKHPYVIYPGQMIRLKPGQKTANKSSPKTNRTSTQKKQSTTQSRPSSSTKALSSSAVVKWRWPVSGKLVQSDSPTAKKGIGITGKRGQNIKAAAAGDVVYSGSGLLGYGKLIIIKHNDTFLSAYAHNDKLFVKEGDKVVVNQKIATMGLDNNGSPLLHFEIRKDGKPVNPLVHLPKK